MRKCRFCHEEIQDASRVCEHCGKELLPPAAAVVVPEPSGRALLAPPPTPVLVQTVVIQASPVTVAQVLTRIAWGAALGVIVLAALAGLVNIQLAASAPQQAAAASMSCFYVIVPYVFARGVQALLDR
jgi:hypothetical protein